MLATLAAYEGDFTSGWSATLQAYIISCILFPVFYFLSGKMKSEYVQKINTVLLTHGKIRFTYLYDLQLVYLSARAVCLKITT